jgi:superfamily I DNA/RNA helicase
VLVKLIDDHGPETIIDAVRRLSDERYASLIISTAHKAKGREWDTVRIADDFREPKKDPERPDKLPQISPPEAMLAYVAVTRAKLTLDRSGLAWVDNYVDAAR